jgi:hypothetical protein
MDKPSAITNPNPPYLGNLQMVFLEKAEYSVSAPLYDPPTTVIVASDTGKAGYVTDVRWTSHTSMGDFGTYISLTIDGLAHAFPLTYGHQNQRDVGRVYGSGPIFRLPLGDGVRFNNSFTVKVYGLPLSPGQVAGGGGVYNIYVGYRTD